MRHVIIWSISGQGPLNSTYSHLLPSLLHAQTVAECATGRGSSSRSRLSLSSGSFINKDSIRFSIPLVWGAKRLIFLIPNFWRCFALFVFPVIIVHWMVKWYINMNINFRSCQSTSMGTTPAPRTMRSSWERYCWERERGELRTLFGLSSRLFLWLIILLIFSWCLSDKSVNSAMKTYCREDMSAPLAQLSQLLPDLVPKDLLKSYSSSEWKKVWSLISCCLLITILSVRMENVYTFWTGKISPLLPIAATDEGIRESCVDVNRRGQDLIPG